MRRDAQPEWSTAIYGLHAGCSSRLFWWALITRIAKKTKMKYSKLGSLEKQKKQKASEWKFKGRAGDKAQRLRKVG